MPSEHIPNESNQPQGLHPDVDTLMFDLSGQLGEALDRQAELRSDVLEGIDESTEDEIQEQTGSSREEFRAFIQGLHPNDLEFLLQEDRTIGDSQYESESRQATDTARARRSINEVFGLDYPDELEDLTVRPEDRAEDHVRAREPFVAGEIAIEGIVDFMNQKAGITDTSAEHALRDEEEPDTPDTDNPQ